MSGANHFFKDVLLCLKFMFMFVIGLCVNKHSGKIASYIIEVKSKNPPTQSNKIPSLTSKVILMTKHTNSHTHTW